ncbi:MAG: hypothetical protein Q8880_07970, partial [Bacteroidota bacterium]|nr:hypothetical protein [Bacteroidota bacterium]
KYVVYASGSQALKRFINKYKSGKTLNKRPDYQSITENISNKANIFLYINMSKSVNLSKAIENNPGNSIASFIANTNFQNLALEFNTSDETFYNTGYITFNQGDNTKHDFEAIWETKLDTTVQTKPFVFISNNSNNREIAVQDVSNNLYLLDNEGTILWKKNIKEKIIGDINEIDYYKNEKYQFLFNTANYIHLIDRNGNEVEGYPIRLNASSSNPLLVVDYKNDKSYRILVACNNRKIYNYTKEGKLNKGWKYTYHENPISGQFQYFNFDDKDCIFITDNKGKVIVLDSKGNIRSNPGNKIVKSYKTKFFIDVLPGRNKTRIVTIDSSGTIYSIYPDWRIQKDKITGLNQSPYFYFKDINNDENREFIFISNKQVKAFDQSKKQIFSLNINFTSTYEPDYYLLRDNIGKIGLVNTEDKEIYLINNKGKIDEGFPLRGSTPFVIEDLNNNDIPDLIVGSDSKVIVYELQ